MTADSADTNEESDDNVRVVVRVRPFNNGEVDAGYEEIVHVDPIHGTIKLDPPENIDPSTNLARDNPAKMFTFDNVFDKKAVQVGQWPVDCWRTVELILEIQYFFTDVYNRVAR